MKWAVAGALVLLCCARQETPAPPKRVTARPAPVQPAPVPRPAPPRVWQVRMLRSGGFAGGMGGFAASSDGANRECVERAVAAARPEGWARVYPKTSQMTDQFHYTLTLESDGRKFETSWSSGSGGAPPDLVQLSKALVTCGAHRVVAKEPGPADRPVQILEPVYWQLAATPVTVALRSKPVPLGSMSRTAARIQFLPPLNCFGAPLTAVT